MLAAVLYGGLFVTEKEDTPTRVVFESMPEKKLQLHFRNFVDSLDIEFGMCLYGQVDEGTVTVSRIEFPPQFQELDKLYARYDLCSEGMVATGHAHPNLIGNTEFSPEDSSALKAQVQSSSKIGVPIEVMVYRPDGKGPIDAKVLDARGYTKQ